MSGLHTLLDHDRLLRLLERLVAPGPKAAHVSASECHEIVDEVHDILDLRRGREAEELRAAFEALTAELAAADSSEVRECAEDTRRILDRVDARDSVVHAGIVQALRARSTHLAYIEPWFDSFRRGGTTRVARCTCGWMGPERGTLELSTDDALVHEREWSGRSP